MALYDILLTAPPSQSASAFPLKVSANGRYLEASDGTPFRLQTDAGWFSCVNYSDADVTNYLNLIQAKGFNCFILMLIVHATDPGHWYGLNQPADYYGNQPFTTPGHFDTPNPTYFARPKSMIDQALARGLVVKLFHTYVGASGATDGWAAELQDAHNTDTVCFNWGVYLAQTFTQPNILWMHGGDNFMSGTVLTRFQQIVAGIQSITRNRLSGSEWAGPASLVTDQTGFVYGTNPATSDMQIDSFYGGGPLDGGGGLTNHTYVTADSSWSRSSPVLPGDLEEPAYVNAWYFSINRCYDIRNAYFWAVLSGAVAGATLGEDHRWNGFPDALSTFTNQGTVERTYANELFQSLPWHLMLPSGTASGYAGRNLVVSGAGSGDSTVASCVTSSGSHMLVFVPRTDPTATTTFAVDLRAMSGACRTRWWNPTTGTFTTAGAGYYDNSLASQSFTTPGSNGSTDSVNGQGSNDWLLVVDLVDTPAFPLRVSANSRYLETQAGVPFRIAADAGWMIGVHANVTDQNTYMSSIKSLGFNAFVLMNIVHGGGTSWANVNEPNDLANVAPFTTPNDFSTANDTYFNKVSDIIDRAKALNLVVLFFHTYLGFGGGNDGWEAAVAAQSNTVCFNWGVYLGTKFTQTNIIWMHGGDHRITDATALARYQQIVAGIQSVTRNRLAGSEWDSPNDHVTAQSGFTYNVNPATSDMQIDSFYGQGTGADGLTYVTADESWSAATTLPSMIEEPSYYLFALESHTSRSEVRAAQHWAFTAGAIAGSNFGHDGRWDWRAADWFATLSEVATLDQRYRHALYNSLSWWLMRPSGTATGYCGRVLVVSGGGTGSSKITSCMSSDGAQLLAYVPPTGTGTTTFSIDFRSMSGTCTAYWWNPTTGVLGSAIGTFANSLSSQSFTTPGDNGSGTNDWMLVCKVPA